MVAAFVMPAGSRSASRQDSLQTARIRTITAGFDPGRNLSLGDAGRAVRFLRAARRRFEAQGHVVQTTRLATPPLRHWLADPASSRGKRFLAELDQLCLEQDMVCSLGPALGSDAYDPEFAGWVANLFAVTSQLSLSVDIAPGGVNIANGAIRSAAETILAIAASPASGEGNFRFAATARVPPGTPFFPAGYFDVTSAFSIGLESPDVLADALAASFEDASVVMAESLDRTCAPVGGLARKLAGANDRAFLGIDTSPAPGVEASIGAVIETLSGVPFGQPGTLAACATVTGALKKLSVPACGYSGLMLPVLEDPVLARRAVENRYGIDELLLYSSVCGTGLDVVPLPGDVAAESITHVLADVAALALRYDKPLSARLLPIPGKTAGEPVTFDDPYLLDSIVMPLGG